MNCIGNPRAFGLMFNRYKLENCIFVFVENEMLSQIRIRKIKNEWKMEHS
jgi:hypothetical protein